LIRRISQNKMLLFIISIFIVALINQPSLTTDFEKSLRGIFVSFAYIVIAGIWGISVMERIQEEKSRIILHLIIGLILSWLVMRGMKYEVWDDSVDIALWYLYYLPQIFLPLLMFFMTDYIDGRKEMKHKKLLVVFASLLVLGILTNNYHQLAFHFKDEISSKGDAYTHGPLFYITYVWMLFFMLAANIRATVKSRIINKKKASAIIFGWTIVSVLFIVYLAVGPFWGRTYLWAFTEGSCFLYISFLEIYIQTGLLVTNRDHNEIFMNASVMAELTDERGETFQRSGECPPVSREQKLALLSGKQVMDDTYEMEAIPIHGGYVFWLKEIRELLRVKQTLESLGEILEEENNILQAEIAAKEQIESIEKQNEIYDYIVGELEDKTNQILRMRDNGSPVNETLILAAYMKRKANLVILSMQENILDVRELGLCINESFSYLSLNGCTCNCTVDGTNSYPAEWIIQSYDIFELILENSYEGLEAFLCYIKAEDMGLYFRFQLEHSEDRPLDEIQLEQLIRNQIGQDFELSIERQDTTTFFTCLVKGGELS